MECAPQNDQMTFPIIQKDIVTACNIEIIKDIIEKLNDDFFSLLIDGSFDVSCKEKIAIFLQYHDRMRLVMEWLIDMIHVQDFSVLS